MHRVNGKQWTVRDEMLALAVERIDHWGLVQAYLHSNGKGLPDQSIEIARPWGDRTPGAGEEKPKKDRYQKQRERAAFFGGYRETA